MRYSYFFLLLLSAVTLTGCTQKVVQKDNAIQITASPHNDLATPKSAPIEWEFEDDTYKENEFSEPFARYYSKEKRKLYAGYEITKTFEKKGGKASIRVNKGVKHVLSIEQENVNSYWLRWGLFPFFGKKASQLVIMKYSGGAHCCASYQIYDLVPEFTLIFDGEVYEMEEIGNYLVPLDINKDGIYEFTQSVMAFDYFHASHAGSVFPTAVFAYDKTVGTYLPANRRYGAYLLKGLDKDLRAASKQMKDYSNSESLAFEGYYYALMNVMLTYTYAGQRQKGWAYFEKNYKRGDKDELQKDLKAVLSGCPIYKSIYGDSIK